MIRPTLITNPYRKLINTGQRYGCYFSCINYNIYCFHQSNHSDFSIGISLTSILDRRTNRNIKWMIRLKIWRLGIWPLHPKHFGAHRGTKHLFIHTYMVTIRNMTSNVYVENSLDDQTDTREMIRRMQQRMNVM